MPSASRAPLRPVVASAKAGARTRPLNFCRGAAKRSRSQDWRAAVHTTRRSSRAAAARATRARKRSSRAASRTPAGSRQGRCLWPAAQLAGGKQGQQGHPHAWHIACLWHMARRERVTKRPRGVRAMIVARVPLACSENQRVRSLLPQLDVVVVPAAARVRLGEGVLERGQF